MPRWAILPNATVAVGLSVLGASGRTNGRWALVCLVFGVLYAVDVGRFFLRPRRERTRGWVPVLLLWLLRPLVWTLLMPPARAVLWAASRGYLIEFKRNHRGLMHPGERLLLTLRESGGDDGDVWVLSNQAIYMGRKRAERRLPRIPREDIIAVSEATLGEVRVVTLTVKSDADPARVVTGCFSNYVFKRPVRRLVTELTSDG